MQSDYAVYRELVSQLLRGEEVLPSLPSLTLEIRRALKDPAVSLPQLERLISRDPALVALLVKQASSVLYRQIRPAQGLREVIPLLGLQQVASITMAHSLRSLYTLHSPAYKELFLEAWQRLTQRAAICAVLARVLGRIQPGHALLASLLGDIGSLILLSAFRDEEQPPSAEHYFHLCREFSQSLGVIVLKKWAVEEHYIDVVRQKGLWQSSTGPTLDVLDLVNLSLYHSIVSREPSADVPPWAELAAYRKLTPPHDELDEQGGLAIISAHQFEIQQLAQSLQ